MNFDSFVNEWIGKRVADPTLGAVGLPADQWYQCVSLIKQYLRECFGIEAGYWGNAIDYWTHTNPGLLGRFDHLQTTDVAKGDIVILNGLPGNTDGHIMIGMGANNTTQFEGLEQNGQTGGGTGLNGDAIRTRWVDKSRIAGVLRPKPVAPAAVHPYTIEDIDPRQVRINKNTHKWGMNYDNLTAIVANPEGDIAAGTVIVASAICHHNIGYNYYLEDPNVPSGYNVVDCDPYEQPVPAVKQSSTPAAPLSAPSTEPYRIVKQIPGYLTSNQAANHLGANTPVTAGTYTIFNKRYDQNNKLIAINVTRKPGQPGSWINPLDNVQTAPVDPPVPTAPLASGIKIPTPASAPLQAAMDAITGAKVVSDVKAVTPANLPADWKPPFFMSAKALADSYRRFTDKSGKPISVTYTNISGVPYILYDLVTGNKPSVLQPGQAIELVGTMLVNGGIWGRAKAAADVFLWHGVPLDTGIVEPDSTVFNAQTSLAERETLHKLRPSDYFVLGAESFMGLLGTIEKAMDIVMPGKNKNKKINK